MKKIDTENLMQQIKALSELELDEFIHELSEHVEKNNLYHVIQNNFFDFDEVPDLENQIALLEEEAEDLARQRDELYDQLFGIKVIISDLYVEFDSKETLWEAIQKIEQILNYENRN